MPQTSFRERGVLGGGNNPENCYVRKSNLTITIPRGGQVYVCFPIGPPKDHEICRLYVMMQAEFQGLALAFLQSQMDV